MLKKICLLLFMLTLIPYNSNAEIKTFTHTVKQPFSGSQSPDEARIAAIAKAKQEVLEIAGTYLETMTVVKEHDVESDDILALAAGVMKAEIVSQKNYASEDAFGIIIETKIDVDTSILDERVKTLLQDQSLLGKYNDQQNRAKRFLSRIEELEKENQKLKDLSQIEQEPKREILKSQFTNVTRSLTASDLFNKALALWENNKYSDPNKALEYLNKAISLDPKYGDAYNNRGLVWLDKGDYDRAMADYTKAIELDPRDSTAYDNRGNIWYDKGDYNRAIADYSKAIELDPRYATAYSNRGVAWDKQGDYDRAMADYTKAIDLDPRYATAYSNRGATWYDKGDYDRAIADYTKAIELDSRHAIAFFNRGLVLIKQGDCDRAITDFTKAIELNPRYTTAYYNRAVTYRICNNSSKSADDYNSYLKINGNKNGDADRVRQKIKDLGYTPFY